VCGYKGLLKGKWVTKAYSSSISVAVRMVRSCLKGISTKRETPMLTITENVKTAIKFHIFVLAEK
jgi:hypothetical protein